MLAYERFQAHLVAVSSRQGIYGLSYFCLPYCRSVWFFPNPYSHAEDSSLNILDLFFHPVDQMLSIISLRPVQIQSSQIDLSGDVDATA